MTRSDADWAAFSREHRVAYELQPLVETQGSEKRQSGFTLTLYAGVPMDKAPGAERQEAGRKLWEELRDLAEAAVPAAERTARVELDPPRTAVLRPENEFKPEVMLSWRIFRGDLQPVTPEDKEQLAGLEKRFAILGLKRGRW